MLLRVIAATRAGFVTQKRSGQFDKLIHLLHLLNYPTCKCNLHLLEATIGNNPVHVVPIGFGLLRVLLHACDRVQGPQLLSRTDGNTVGTV